MPEDFNNETTQFPDYGDGGDLVGTKRLRRSFLLCVLGVIVLTIGMWVSEKEFRFGHTESLYISGITLSDKSSGRVLLLQAIKADAAANEKQTGKYTQALAVREEDDVILRRFDEAQAIDNRNALFTIRHGSRLFIKGFPEEALRKYRDAEQLLEGTQPNSLPGYLQAAAIAQKRSDPVAIKNAMIAVAKTNSREGDVIFPTPFWFSAYPKTGMHYAQLQREIIDETCAPLYTLTAYAVKSIDDKISKGQYNDARMWIGYLDQMGDRLLKQSQPMGTIQATEGIRIKLACNKLLEKIEAAQEGNVTKETLETSFKLTAFQNELIAYENDRDKAIQLERSRITRPNLVAIVSWLIVMGVWFLFWCLSWFFTPRENAWSLKYNGFGKIMLGGGNLTLFTLLCCYYAFNNLEGFPYGYIDVLTWAWVGCGLILLCMGMVFPLTMLKSPDEAARKQARPGDIDNVLRFARVAYRQSYFELMYRYYGALAGLNTFVLCAWILLFRLSQGLFPWQVNLIAKGFLDSEFALVERLLQTL